MTLPYYKNGRKYVCNSRTQNVLYSFWLNLKDEIEFIIKSNESLAENKIKNDIEQFLSKYKYGNNIHKHVKQQKRINCINQFLTCHKD